MTGGTSLIAALMSSFSQTDDALNLTSLEVLVI